MTPSGWPQLVLYCIGKTYTGQEYVKSYGSCHIPIESGMHNKKVRMFSPVETSGIWEYFGFTSETEGLSAIVNNPRAIAMPDGREVSRVKASGTISI
tara:strand:- start:160 stop:450 length:291 start_codon:yes stop_codon:yes gene_type:complete